MEPFISHTCSDRALAAEVQKLRNKIEPGRQLLIWLLLAVSVILLVISILQRVWLTVGAAAVILLFSGWNGIKILRLRRGDSNGKHRTTEFTEELIRITVRESGNVYERTWPEIMAAAVSDNAAVIYFPTAMTAVSREGFSGGRFDEFCALLTEKTAEKTAKYRKAVTVSMIPLMLMLLLMLAGIVFCFIPA